MNDSEPSDEWIQPTDVELPSRSNKKRRYAVLAIHDTEPYEHHSIKHILLDDRDTAAYLIATNRPAVDLRAIKVQSRFALCAKTIDHIEYDGTHHEFEDWVAHKPDEFATHVRTLLHKNGHNGGVQAVAPSSVTIRDYVSTEPPWSFTVHLATEQGGD